jgi:hypothetical protein
MVGFYTPGDIGSVAADSLGTSILPAPTGQGIRSAFSQSAEQVGKNWATLNDWMGGNTGADLSGEPGPDTLFGTTPPPVKPPPMLDPAAATKQYGLPGLSFTAPVSQDAAEAMYQSKHNELVRQDQIARTSGLGATIGEGVASLLPQLADPINIASMFVPGIPEARIATALGMETGSILTRALAGASAGAIGQAALTPAIYAMDQAQGNDFTMGQALEQIAFGGLLGGGLHVLGGTLEDFIRSRRGLMPADAKPDFGGNDPLTPEQAANPLTAMAERATPDLRDTALRSSLASVVDDQPINVSAIFDAADIPRSTDKAPPSLLTFLTQRGGVNDTGGDLAAMDAGLQRVGFLRKNGGQTLDYAREAAEEAGYLKRGSDTNNLLEAIRTELSGQKVYPPEYQASIDATQMAARESDQYAAALSGAREAVMMASEDRGVDLRPDEIDHAAHLTIGGLHPDDAVQSAISASEQSALPDESGAIASQQDGIASMHEALRRPDPPDTIQAKRMNDAAVQRAPTIAARDTEAQLGEATVAYEKAKQRIQASGDESFAQALADHEKSVNGDEGYAKALEAAGACLASRVS